MHCSELPAKIRKTASGMRKISLNATILRMFLDWNSTKLIRNLAPHHAF
jgi:hypothetical protein